MSVICYLLDEHVNPVIRRELLRHEPAMVIWKIGDPSAPRRGTPDPEILKWCELNLFTLVTNNRHSMPGHLQDHLDAGGHIPGILELHPNMSIGETVSELLLIWGASLADEYRNRIIYLPIT